MMKDLHGMPIKWDGDDGDAMLWAGLMTAVGDTKPIEGIKMCQSEDGRLWRSPNRVNKDTKNTFSRDMALGFILYFQQTQDHEMADKWISYLKKEGSLFPKEESNDTRHIVTPALWWLMSYAGMKVPLVWRLTRFLFTPYQAIELRFTPRGYERHLKAVAAFIMSKANGKRDTATGKFLIKEDKENPFFQWLSGTSSYSVYRMMMGHKEYWLSYPYGRGSQWSWERSDNESAWLDAMGQDFDFIEKLTELDLD